jgi:hypothetical protein
MARNLPATSTPAAAPRVIYYVDPVPDRGQLTQATGAQVEARRRAQHIAYLRWKARQAEIAERDRKVRRFMLGFGAVTGLGVLAALGVAVWLVVHALGTALLAVPLVLLGIPALAFGGRRCITIVQHWH